MDLSPMTEQARGGRPWPLVTFQSGSCFSTFSPMGVESKPTILSQSRANENLTQINWQVLLQPIASRI